MSRLIDADKAKEVLKHLLYETAMNNTDISAIYEDIAENRLDVWIDSAPTVDAEPIRYGHWIYHSDWADDGECPYECPYCGRTYDYDMNFCGFCGAKMDEVTG